MRDAVVCAVSAHVTLSATMRDSVGQRTLQVRASHLATGYKSLSILQSSVESAEFSYIKRARPKAKSAATLSFLFPDDW